VDAHAFVTQNRLRGRIPCHEHCAVYFPVANFWRARVGIDVAAFVNVTVYAPRERFWVQTT